MSARFSIHPGIGIARLGNSPTSFCIASEQRAGLPIDCDQDGTPVVKDGVEQPVQAFVDPTGRIRRQAARFAVFVYDDRTPDGREISLGDTFDVVNQTPGQLQTVRLDDIRWTVYLANKKAGWYEFQESAGEHGYDSDHKLRNADITDINLRQRLIIDPGPRSVTYKSRGQRRAQFTDGGPPSSFPPPLSPNSITTLGELICTRSGDHNRLLVLGGFGNSGSMLTDFGNPKIEAYANNEGWFDDISDGPVSATLICTVLSISGQPAPPGQRPASVPVDNPAWVVVGYPRYVPEIPDIVTIDDVALDVAVRNFAAVPFMYGVPPFDAAPADGNLTRWRRLAQWNSKFRPYFYRDIWPILGDPINYSQVMDKDSTFGGNPHDTSSGGNLDQSVLAVPPFEGEDPADRERRRAKREYLFSLLRKPGQENQLLTAFDNRDGPLLFLMPLLCGDNPLSNVAASKFFRLTDTMLFMLRQWAAGLFINEQTEGIVPPPLLKGPGRALDRGALASGLGGSFCPGAEASWIIRNPAIYASAYRINPAVPSFGALSQPPRLPGGAPATAANIQAGMEPGDLTKYSAVPWQSDFNECTNQPVDVTYASWNTLDLDSVGDPAATRQQLTYWWPAHRPVYVNYVSGTAPWSPTAQNNAGDLQMVTAWARQHILRVTDQGMVPADSATPAS